MAAVKTATDPKRRSDFLDSMEEERRRVSEHLERRERRLGLKGRRAGGDLMNGYSLSFSEGSGAEAGARRRRINHYPRQFRPSEDDHSSTSSPDTHSPSPGPRSAPPVHSPRSCLSEQLPSNARSDSSTPEAASPAADHNHSHQSAMSQEDVADRSRRAESSPLRTPPPVAPKPRSRGSPGPVSPRRSPGPLSPQYRPRAASAPLRPRCRETRAVQQQQQQLEAEKEEEEELELVVEEVSLEATVEALEDTPTPVPATEQLSPSLTPEPSEPLLVIHQSHKTPDSPPPPSSSSSSLEIIEPQRKDAASPGIIEISGNFSFDKKGTLDSKTERNVSPIAEEEEETGVGEEGEGEREGEEVEREEGEREEGEGEEEREEGEENVENALLEAMMEGGTYEERSDAVIIEDPPLVQLHEEPPSDPQGPEIKSLPLMSPASGRCVGVRPNQQHRRAHEELRLRELQLQLREKEEELGRQRRAAERDAREREEQVARLMRETQKLEREKWELLKRARDGAERSLSLRTQLDVKETQLRSLQADLIRNRDEMISVKSANTSLRALLSELRTPKPSKDVGVQVSVDGGTLKRNHSMELAVQELSRPSSGALERGIDFRASTTNLDRGTNHRISNCSAMSDGWSMTQGSWERHSDHWVREQSVTSISSSQYGSRETTPTSSPQSGKKTKKKRGALFGKLRKSTGKRGSTPTILDGVDLTQSSLLQGHGRPPISFPYHPRLSAETQDHWRTLDETQHVPFQCWNGRAIVAWVTTGLGMGQYVAAIRDRVTTGNAMLALSDAEMDKKLGVTSVLHRRKLRLAIEEQRRPDRVRYPLAGKIDTGWLAEVWLADIGLPHLADTMATHLVDGRVLESLTRDDLKKYFKMSKKLELTSFQAGVELLRMHDFNRETVQSHRASQQSRSSHQNPLYWTNRDVADWIRDIQLGEYATNLLGSGVHGALLFLERGEKSKFSADHLSHVLQLPGGKSPARRHLAMQMTRLFRDEATCEPPFHSQHSSATSFQSNLSGNSSLSPPYSGSLYRAGSSPSLNQTEHMSLEEKIRHSLRESALRSVTASSLSPRTPSPSSSSPSSQFPQYTPPSPHTPCPPSQHPHSPHLPSAPSPLTHTTASGTTV